MAAIARRRLELLSAELEGIRPLPTDGPSDEPDEPGGPDGPSDEPDRHAHGLSSGEELREHPQPESAEETGATPLGGRTPDDGWFWDQRDASGEPETPGHLPRGRHARRPVNASGRVGGWVHDRLPPTLQGRVHLSPSHLTTVALLVAAGFAVTAWWVVRADAGETVVPVSTWSVADSGGPSTSPEPLVTPAADPSASASTAAQPAVVVVDVAGKVRRPGIATLPVGSRVVDALKAAGGARRGVDLTSLNLARVLVDGEQVLVGIEAPGGVAGSAASGTGSSSGEAGPMVNINLATQSELEELPGVGPVTASAILQWREEHGPFTAVDELLEVSGIGDATLADMAPFVTL